MSFPILATPRLTLDALTNRDTLSIFELFSSPCVIEYYNLEAFETPVQASNIIALFKSRFDDGLGIRWAIRLKETGQLVGTCGFNSWNVKMKSAVIGYDLMPEYWGKGITSEAVEKIVEAAFSGQLSCGRIHRIQADTVIGNIASESLLLKVGFHEEGVRRDSGYWKGQFHDLKCFGLLASN